MKNSRLLFHCLAFLISLNLVFSSLYPAIGYVQNVYAQDDEDAGSDDGGDDEEEPASDESSAGEEDGFEEYSEETEEAQTQTPEEPQESAIVQEVERLEIIEQIRTEQTGPTSEPRAIFDEESQEAALENYKNDAQVDSLLAQEQQAQAREVQGEELQNISSAFADAPQEFTEAVGDAIQVPIEAIANLAEELPRGTQVQLVDDSLSQEFAQITDQSQQQVQTTQEQIDETLFAPEQQRADALANVLDLPAGALPDEIFGVLAQEAQVAGIQVSGNLNEFEIIIQPQTGEYPLEYYAQIEQERLTLEDLLIKTENLAKFLEEVKWSTVTLGLYDWGKFVAETNNQIQSDAGKLSQLNQARNADNRVDVALRLTGSYFELGQMSDEQVADLVNKIAEDYGFDVGAVSAQLTAERDYRNLSHDIVNKQNLLNLEVAANAVITAVGLIPGSPVDDAARAGKPALRELVSLVRRGEAPPVFIGHLQEKQILDYLGQPTVDLSRLDQEIERLTKIKAEHDAFRIFGRADEQTLAKTIDWVDFDVSSETIDRAWQQADQIFGPIGDAQNLAAFEAGEVSSYVGPANIRDISEELRSVHPAIRDLRYELSISGVTDEQFVTLSFSKDDLVAALIKRDLDRQQLEPVLEETRKVYGGIEDFIRTNGNDPNFAFDNLDQTLDVRGIHLTPNRVWEMEGWEGTLLGQYRPGEDLVLIGYEGRTTAEILGTCVHECSHRAQDINGALSSFSSPAAKALDELSLREYKALTEGVTQHFAEKGQELTGHRGFNRTYVSEVERVQYNLNAAIVRNKGVTSEQAEAIILKTGGDGSYDELIEAAGGTGEIRRIFGDTFTEPAVVSDVVVGPSRTEIERAIAGSEVNVTTYSYRPGVPVTGEGSITPIVPIEPTNAGGIDGFFNNVGNTLNNTRNAVGNFFGGLFGGGQQQVKGTHSTRYARSGQASEPMAVDADAFELLAKREIIKEKLREDRKVDSNYVREVLRSNILESTFIRQGGGYAVITGRTGIAEGEVEPGRYILRMEGIAGLDVKVPKVVEVGGGNILVPIGVREGEGEVERISYEDKSLVSKVSAQDTTGNVTVVVFSDKNGNGKLDRNESVLPWAGVSATLEPLDQTRVVSLLSGWNLITLTSLPSEPLSASKLLGDIAQDGGYATTVSTLENGSWKSYVMRGDSTFSGDDFPILPGKAYFVKSTKRSVLYFNGREFQAPVEVSLTSGWNAIGFPRTSQNYSVSTILNKAQGDVASRWESGLWDSFVREQQEDYGNDFAIEKNRGYLIRAKEGGKFAP